jgi:hypothetical protein
MIAKAKGGAKGGAAGKGITKPRMTAAQKARLPHSFCSGGCGAFGVVGKQHKEQLAGGEGGEVWQVSGNRVRHVIARE